MGKMGKKRRGASWLSVVKRVFQCSPTHNEEDENVKTGTKQDDHSQEEKEKLMQRWVMEAPTKIQVQQCPKSKTAAGNAVTSMEDLKGHPSQERQAFAAAVSTAANATEAAAATARAAVDIARLATRPSGKLITRLQAATIIQKAFRGYLARRALRALKGLVKLQALIRGQNARKQTETALNCIKALLQVKNGHLCDQRARVSMSHEGSRSSMLSKTNNLWESAYLQDIEHHRLSTSRRDCFDKSGRKEAALRREKALAYAFSNQIWRTGRHSSFGDQRELQERTRWFDRWMATKQWEHSSRRASTDRSGPIDSVETDPFKKPCSPCCATIDTRSLKPQTGFSPQCCTPPNRRPCYSSLQQSPFTPPFSVAMPLHVCTDSPHYYRAEKSHSTSHSPCLGDGYPLDRNSTANATTPNYMAATESAKARVRSLSTPRQRPLVPERGRGGSIRKRLSYPVPISELDGGRGNGGYCTVQELRSPSLKSFHGERYEPDQHSSMFSYLDRMGREISPASTTDLRLWLR